MVDAGAIAGAGATILTVLASHLRTRRALRNDFIDIRNQLTKHIEEHDMEDMIEANRLREQVTLLLRKLNGED